MYVPVERMKRFEDVQRDGNGEEGRVSIEAAGGVGAFALGV